MMANLLECTWAPGWSHLEHHHWFPRERQQWPGVVRSEQTSSESPQRPALMISTQTCECAGQSTVAVCASSTTATNPNGRADRSTETAFPFDNCLPVLIQKQTVPRKLYHRHSAMHWHLTNSVCYGQWLAVYSVLNWKWVFTTEKQWPRSLHLQVEGAVWANALKVGCTGITQGDFAQGEWASLMRILFVCHYWKH